MCRFDLTDFEWRVMQPLLPEKLQDNPRVDDRGLMNGIFLALRSGLPWRDPPERYGPYETVYDRFNRWRRAGVWDRLMDSITATSDCRVQMIDTSVVRVHRVGGLEHLRLGTPTVIVPSALLAAAIVLTPLT